ncbi:MAG: nucleoside recognition domain-containing protein [Myxococcaceae bacterium]
MLNGIFVVLVAGSIVVAAFTGRLADVNRAWPDASIDAVSLAIKLIGPMALWLGFMGVLREAGLLASIARLLRPVMRRLFPDVPADSPAIGAMILNISANILGVGNAATPFGLKAISELNQLNPYPGVASNSMALFVAINTSGLAVLPLGVITVRSALGSKDPAAIFLPSMLATMSSAVVAVVACKLLQRLPRFAPERVVLQDGPPPAPPPKAPDAAAADAAAEQAALPHAPASPLRRLVTLAVVVALVAGLVRSLLTLRVGHTPFEVFRTAMSGWILPILMFSIVLFGFARRVKVYEVLVTAGKEGFQVAVLIIPYLVAIMVAVAVFRASGAMDAIVGVLGKVTGPLGFPPEALPMALIRPLSGTGAIGVLAETMKTYGPDSFIGYLTSTINGSMETTFYVLAVYFGSVQVRALRHTVAACLLTDLSGIIMSTVLCHLFFR